MDNEAQTPATDFWSAADKAILGLCETLALLFGLPFGEDLYNDRPIAGWHIFYSAVGLMFAIAGPMLVYLRTRPWFSKKASETLSRIATDPLVWLAILLARIPTVLVRSCIYERLVLCLSFPQRQPPRSYPSRTRRLRNSAPRGQMPSPKETTH